MIAFLIFALIIVPMLIGGLMGLAEVSGLGLILGGVVFLLSFPVGVGMGQSDPVLGSILFFSMLFAPVWMPYLVRGIRGNQPTKDWSLTYMEDQKKRHKGHYLACQRSTIYDDGTCTCDQFETFINVDGVQDLRPRVPLVLVKMNRDNVIPLFKDDDHKSSR